MHRKAQEHRIAASVGVAIAILGSLSIGIPYLQIVLSLNHICIVYRSLSPLTLYLMRYVFQRYV